MPIDPPVLPKSKFSGLAHLSDGFLENYLNQVVSQVLSIGGGSVSVNADYTASLADYSIFVDASGGDVTITLPTAVGNAAKTYSISKRDATGNAVNIDGDGVETINGETVQTISVQYNAVVLISDGSEWGIF